MVDYSVSNYNSHGTLLNNSYYTPSFYDINANTKQAVSSRNYQVINYASQPDSIIFGNNKQINFAKPEKKTFLN